MLKPRIIALGMCLVVACIAAPSLGMEQVWRVNGGTTNVVLDVAALEELGLHVAASSGATGAGQPHNIEIAVDTASSFTVSADNGRLLEILSGDIRHADGLVISSKAGSYTIDSLLLIADGAPESVGFSVMSMNEPHGFSPLNADDNKLALDVPGRSMFLESGDLVISADLAEALGDPSLAGSILGQFATSATIELIAGELFAGGADQGASPRGGCTPSTGPDVIVGDVVVNSSSNYSTSGSIDAFSWGTTSCNIGSQNLLWQASNSNHPVIPQNMYRLKTVDGVVRFEQIGQGWLKHGFTALTQNLCCTCSGQGGSVLGVGCSDPYTSGRNGTQCTTTGGLGPRFQVNAHTGAFTFPYMFRNNCSYIPHTSVTRRCQVHVDDLNSTLNPGALYYAEAQYVTPDDAAALNQNNNSSYERITISGSGNYSASSAGSTVQQKAAIQAWKTADPTVTETIISTPENSGANPTGRLILAAKATELSHGQWHYEYALYNMNSDRSVSSFIVPLPNGFSVEGIGFHDVPYHSGDGFNSSTGSPVTYDGTDWPGVYGGGNVAWALVPASPSGNSNALRWGTMYNYRFITNSPPTTGNVTLGLFKAVAGQPDSVAATTVVPTPTVPCACDGDVNLSLTVDGLDVQLFTDMAVGMAAVNTCADVALPQNGTLDAADYSAFVDLLLDGNCN